MRKDRNKKEEVLGSSGEYSSKWLLFKKISSVLGIYGAVVATILATFSLVEIVAEKEHSLEIYVANISADEEYVEFTVAYYNSGDYAEVLSSVQLFLVQEIEGYKDPMYWDQAECNEPMLIESTKTMYRNYKAKIDFTNDKLNRVHAKNNTFELSLQFDFLAKEFGKSSERFSVARLVPYESPQNGLRSSISFYTTIRKVDFDDASPVNIRTTYPRNISSINSDFCGKKM